MSTFKINKGVVDNLESSLSGKSSTDLDNLSQTGEAHFANSALSNSPYTTNRILEIPQDIKLELVDGTLTLKAGSKVYVPNGFEEDGTTPKFDVVTIQSDLSYIEPLTNAITAQVFYDINKNTLIRRGRNPESGSSVPSGFHSVFYNTSTNLCYNYLSGTQESKFSFPICICTSNGQETNNISSIDQIFNGFGYIGSTVFALPGWKFQGTFGVNVDGTYKTKIFTLNSVHTATIGNYTFNFYETGLDIREDGSIAYFGCYTNSLKTSDTQPSGTNFMWWNPLTGETHHVDNSGVVGSACVISPRIGLASAVSGKFTSIIQKPIDSVANSNASNFSSAGRSYLSGLGMPSKRYIDLTLGASGADYTAPVNGYVSLQMTSSSASQSFCSLTNMTAGTMVVRCFAYAANAPLRVILPIRKGDLFEPTYSNATGTLFRFVYAEGEN